MSRSGLQKRHKLETDESLQPFKRQIIFCNRFYKREREKFYSTVNLRNVTDNKKFGKNIKPVFTNKGNSRNEITLMEGEK